NSMAAIYELNDYLEEKKEELEGKIKILTSIELNVNKGCHIIIIFPDTINVENIRDFLTEFALSNPTNEDYIEKETIHYFENTISKSKRDIKEILNECKKRGFITLAPHATNHSRGFFKLDQPEQNLIIQNDLLNIFDCNKIPQYFQIENKMLFEKMAIINCTDAHSIDKIGTKATWIKMDFPRFKSLQQVIYEPKIRISNKKPQSKIEYKIIGFTIDGGMLKDEKIHFNENYNAIIGGTGSGKSAILDVFKYVFNKFGYNPKFKKISIKRLYDIHKPGTKFVLYCQSNDNIYKIIREIPTIENFSNKLEKNIDKLINDLPNPKIFKLIANKFQKITTNLEDIFIPIIYGQNEILDYSFEPKELIRVFDAKIKNNKYNEFKNLYNKLRKDIRIFEEIKDLNDKKEDLELKIEEANNDIKNNEDIIKEIKNKFPKLEIYKREKILMKDLIEKLEKNLKLIDQFIKDSDFEFVLFNITEVENKDQFIKINNKIRKILRIINIINNAIYQYKHRFNEIKRINNQELQKIYKNYENDFNEYCKKNDIQKIFEIQNYISQRENDLSQFINEKKEIETLIEDLMEKKEIFLQEIEFLYEKQKQLELDWNHQAELFTNKMQGATKIKIDLIPNIDEFKIILKDLDLNSNQIKKITNKFAPKEFANLYEKDKTILKAKLAELNFKEKTIDKIIGNITDLNLYKIKLCIDELNVKFFLKKNNKFFPIDELSIGERCATLLNFIFCEGKEPVIIDQPEDNIDYNYIKETIKILKEHKLKRQFIIVSHNQNLPVLAD
ncbi:MAG: hypothetical protein ACTSQP_24525, partial [Promethearchaeota archaeon]